MNEKEELELLDRRDDLIYELSKVVQELTGTSVNIEEMDQSFMFNAITEAMHNYLLSEQED